MKWFEGGLWKDNQRKSMYRLQKTAGLLASERLYLSGRKSWQELMNSAREAYQAETLVVDAKISAWQAQQKLLLISQSLDAYLLQQKP